MENLDAFDAAYADAYGVEYVRPEEWRAVVGFEGKYEVSNAGRVRSLPHPVRLVTRQGKETTRLSPGIMLTLTPQASGHLYVYLGRKNRRMVHRLVLEAFVGPCPPGEECLHKNHKAADNRLCNLKWGTRSENLEMDYATGSRVYLTFAGGR